MGKIWRDFCAWLTDTPAEKQEKQLLCGELRELAYYARSRHTAIALVTSATEHCQYERSVSLRKSDVWFRRAQVAAEHDADLAERALDLGRYYLGLSEQYAIQCDAFRRSHGEMMTREHDLLADYNQAMSRGAQLGLDLEEFRVEMPTLGTHRVSTGIDEYVLRLVSEAEAGAFEDDEEEYLEQVFARLERGVQTEGVH